jgi:hypothetical protein
MNGAIVRPFGRSNSDRTSYAPGGATAFGSTHVIRGPTEIERFGAVNSREIVYSPGPGFVFGGGLWRDRRRNFGASLPKRGATEEGPGPVSLGGRSFGRNPNVVWW